MSSFYGKAINPKTGKEEVALYSDDYYGKHKYGVIFNDGLAYPIDEIEKTQEEKP